MCSVVTWLGKFYEERGEGFRCRLFCILRFLSLEQICAWLEWTAEVLSFCCVIECSILCFLSFLLMLEVDWLDCMGGLYGWMNRFVFVGYSCTVLL